MADQNKRLCDAIKNENIADAQTCLQCGADPNAEVDSVTAMHLAAGIGLEPVCLLLQHNGDPNIRAADGTTPLHVASIWGFSDCMQILLANGGNPSITDQDGLNALDLARTYNNDGVVEVLEHAVYLLSMEGDQTVTPKFTYRRFSCDSVSTDSASLDLDPDPDPDMFDADEELHRTHDLETYWNQLDRRDGRRRSSFYLRSLQNQVDQFFRDGRRTHIVDVTSPDHPYIEERATPQATSSKVDPGRDRSPCDNEDSQLAMQQQSDWSPSDSEDSLHLHLSVSDKGDQSNQDSFVTCDGEDLDTVLSKSVEDLSDVSEDYDDYTRHCGNTVVKNPKFSSSSKHQTQDVSEVGDCAALPDDINMTAAVNMSNNNTQNIKTSDNVNWRTEKQKINSHMRVQRCLTDVYNGNPSNQSIQGEFRTGIDIDTHGMKQSTPGRKSGEYRKQRYCHRDILSDPSNKSLMSVDEVNSYTTKQRLLCQRNEIKTGGPNKFRDNHLGARILPTGIPDVGRKLREQSTTLDAYSRARIEQKGHNQQLGHNQQVGSDIQTRHGLEMESDCSVHNSQSFSKTQEYVSVPKCYFCGKQAVTQGQDGLVCDGCDKLSQELDHLIEASEPSVPDLIASLSRHSTTHPTTDLIREPVLTSCNPLAKSQSLRLSEENQHSHANLEQFQLNRKKPVPRSSPNDNLDTVTMNDITWQMKNTKLSFCPKSDGLSTLTHVTALEDLSDSILTTDESFFERRRPSAIVKSVFHDSDISTLSADSAQSYPTIASVQSGKTPVNNSNSANETLADSSPDISLSFSDNTLNDYEVSNALNYTNSIRKNKSKNKSNHKLKNLDCVDYAQRENNFRTTGSRKPTNDGKIETISEDFSQNPDPLSSQKVPSPSSQMSDLWTEVRACCQGRKTFRDKTNILNTAFCGRDSVATTITSDASTVDYVYTDKENGIALIERHLPSLCGSVVSRRSVNSTVSETSSKRASPVLNANSSDASQDTQLYDWREHAVIVNTDDSDVSVCSLSSELKNLDNTVIRDKLRKIGDEPGPVTDSTRQTYLRRLSQLKDNPGHVLTKKQPDYPPELRQALDGNLDMSDMSELEAKMIEAFQNPDRNRRWREGTVKSSFTYILLDPNITRNLPNRANNMGDLEVFRTFISAIFYVGKGKRARPYCHLYEAIKQQKNTAANKVSEKVQLILDIWAGGQGVVSLHCFQSVIPVEAYTREACMVDAIGLDRLTNKKRGDYYGVSVTYSMKQRRKMGVYLLTKALQIFLAEGERQIAPLDLQKNT